MFFDSHAHLDDDRFSPDREKVINSLKKNGVDFYINVGADMLSSEKSIKLAEEYDFIYASVGVHPHDAASLTEEDMARLKKMLTHKKVVALGEIGLDYFYDNSPRDIQKKWFIRQLQIAKETDMPVIIHCRDAVGECMDIIRKSEHKKGVMHCFSGSAETAEELASMGWYVSFSGSVTFKNVEKLRRAASAVPLDRLMIETDSPYLSPEPVRGTRNTPQNVRYVAEKIAEIKQISVEEVAKITFENAKKFFNIQC